MTTTVIDSNCHDCSGRGYLPLKVNGKPTQKTVNCHCAVEAGTAEVVEEPWEIVAGDLVAGEQS